MKNLSHISNEQLHRLTLQSAHTEKSATLDLLEHLAEVDRRRLYAEKSFPSLWVYVHEFLGYSESQTSERVNSMRLMLKFPEVKKKLEEGSLSLTSTSKLATHIRREKTGAMESLELLHAISGKPTREVEKLLAQKSTVEVHLDKLKTINPETTRILIDVDREFMQLLNRIRELKGHPGSSTQELLKLAMQNLVKKHEIKPSNQNPIPHPSSKPNHASRYIPYKIKNEIRTRSGDQCEYTDPSTGKRCECKTKLEFDHITPFAWGGSNRLENLRHYCSAHNQFSAIRQFGLKHMSPFLKN